MKYAHFDFIIDRVGQLAVRKHEKTERKNCNIFIHGVHEGCAQTKYCLELNSGKIRKLSHIRETLQIRVIHVADH